MFSSNKNEEISHKQADISDSDFSPHSTPTPCLLHYDTQQVGLVLQKGAEFKGSSFVGEFWSRVGFCSPGWQRRVNGWRQAGRGSWSRVRTGSEEEEWSINVRLTRPKKTKFVKLRLMYFLSGMYVRVSNSRAITKRHHGCNIVTK